MLFLPQISVGYPRQVIQVFYLIFFFVFAFVVNYGSRAVRKFEQIVQAQFVYFDPELPVFFSLNFKNADKHWIYWDIEPNNLSENYAQFYNCFFRSIPVFLRNSPH